MGRPVQSRHAKAAAEPVIFQTPSENIACKMTSTKVVCNIFTFSWSPPPVPPDCEYPASKSWGHAIALTPSGPTFLCADGVVVEAGNGVPILKYGKAVGVGPFACESRKEALICIAKSSRGIYLSRQKLKLF
jgi:hypothetical protein